MLNKLKYKINFCEAFEAKYLYNNKEFSEQFDKYINNCFEECKIEICINYLKINEMFNNKKDLDYIIYDFMPKLSVYLRLHFELNSYITEDCLVIKL